MLRFSKHALERKHQRYVSEEQIKTAVSDAVKLGWRSWTKVDQRLREGADGYKGSHVLRISYYDVVVICCPPDQKGFVHVITVYFSEENHFHYMEPKLSKEQMRVWYEIVSCVWSFDSEKESSKSVFSSLNVLLPRMEGTPGFTNQEMRKILISKPQFCPMEEDIPLMDIASLLISRRDDLSTALISKYWQDDCTHTFPCATGYYHVVVLTNCQVLDGKIWDFERNSVNGLIECSSAPISTELSQDQQFKIAAELLMTAGHDPNLADVNGWNPVLWAARHGNLSLLSLLVRRGGSLFVHERHRWKAMHLAVMSDNIEVTVFILEWVKFSGFVSERIKDLSVFSVTDTLMDEYLIGDLHQRGFGYDEIRGTCMKQLIEVWKSVLSDMISQSVIDTTAHIRHVLHLDDPLLGDLSGNWLQSFVDSTDWSGRSALMWSKSLSVLRCLLFHGASTALLSNTYASNQLHDVAFANTHTVDYAALLLSAAAFAGPDVLLKMLTAIEKSGRTALAQAVLKGGRQDITTIIILAYLVMLTQKGNCRDSDIVLQIGELRWQAASRSLTDDKKKFDLHLRNHSGQHSSYHSGDVLYCHPDSLLGRNDEKEGAGSRVVAGVLSRSMRAVRQPVAFVVPYIWRERISSGVLVENSGAICICPSVDQNDRLIQVNSIILAPVCRAGQRVIFATYTSGEVALVFPDISDEGMATQFDSLQLDKPITRVGPDSVVEVDGSSDSAMKKEMTPEMAPTPQQRHSRHTAFSAPPLVPSRSSAGTPWQRGGFVPHTHSSTVPIGKEQSSRTVCVHFQRASGCRFGDTCKNLHSTAGAGVPADASRQDNWRRKNYK